MSRPLDYQDPVTWLRIYLQDVPENPGIPVEPPAGHKTGPGIFIFCCFELEYSDKVVPRVLPGGTVSIDPFQFGTVPAVKYIIKPFRIAPRDHYFSLPVPGSQRCGNNHKKGKQEQIFFHDFFSMDADEQNLMRVLNCYFFACLESFHETRG